MAGKEGEGGAEKKRRGEKHTCRWVQMMGWWERQGSEEEKETMQAERDQARTRASEEHGKPCKQRGTRRGSERARSMGNDASRTKRKFAPSFASGDLQVTNRHHGPNSDVHYNFLQREIYEHENFEHKLQIANSYYYYCYKT
jgi:hypothetical protein